MGRSASLKIDPFASANAPRTANDNFFAIISSDTLDYETDVVADGRGRDVQYTYPEGDQELFTYDDHGNTLSRTRQAKPGCSTNCSIAISATWDPNWNKPLTITDGNGNVTSFAYYASGHNGAGEIETATRPAVGGVSPVYNFTYDSNGKLLTATDPVTSSTSITTTNTYDSAENLASTTVDSGSGSHLNLTTSYVYDVNGNQVVATDPRGNVTAMIYDADRRKLQSLHHDGNGSANLNSASQTLYDVIGRDIEDDVATAFSGTTVSTWTAVKKTTYTPTSKAATITDGDGDVTTNTYDNVDRVLTVADPIGRKTHYVMDAGGEVLQELRAWGGNDNNCADAGILQECYATYTYGQDGEKLSVYDADGATHITTYAYDGFNRPLTTTFPDGSTEQITGYDSNSNILSHVTRASQTITETYDALNRNLTKALPATGSIAADTITFSYDLGGRKTGYSDTLGNAIALTNDTAGRLTSVATTMPGLSGAKTASYTLDANSNRTKLQWPDGYYATYSYDSLNRMMTVADSVAVGNLATYTYDDFSRRTNLTYTNGASMAYAYTTAGDLTSLTNTLNGASYNNAYTLGYTGAHELASEAFSNLAYTYAPPTGTDTYAAVNVLNQYPAVTPSGQGAQTISYDGNGNLISASGWTYAYDAENKMMTASNGGAVSAAYAYDPLGRRTEKSGTGVATTFFLNDGADEIAEYDGSGDVLRRFVPGPAINEPVIFEDCTGATQPNCTGSGVVNNFFHTDHHGSVVELSIWGATPANTQPYVYDSYGNNPSMPLTGEPFRYVGMYLDAETGLYQDRSRMYSPALGRFMQTDAVGYDVDVNDYTYVGNDPTDRTDPTGMMDCGGNGSDMVSCSGGQIAGKLVSGSSQNMAGRLQVAQNEEIENRLPGEYSREIEQKIDPDRDEEIKSDENTSARLRYDYSRGPGRDRPFPNLVIGRGNDLGRLNPNEVKLQWPSRGGITEEDVKMNNFLLRSWMSLRRPIRDASVGNSDGYYLQLEREWLIRAGWTALTYNENTTYWIPPGQSHP